MKNFLLNISTLAMALLSTYFLVLNIRNPQWLESNPVRIPAKGLTTFVAAILVATLIFFFLPSILDVSDDSAAMFAIVIVLIAPFVTLMTFIMDRQW